MKKLFITLLLLILPTSHIQPTNWKDISFRSLMAIFAAGSAYSVKLSLTDDIDPTLSSTAREYIRWLFAIPATSAITALFSYYAYNGLNHNSNSPVFFNNTFVERIIGTLKTYFESINLKKYALNGFLLFTPLIFFVAIKKILKKNEKDKDLSKNQIVMIKLIATACAITAYIYIFKNILIAAIKEGVKEGVKEKIKQRIARLKEKRLKKISAKIPI